MMTITGNIKKVTASMIQRVPKINKAILLAYNQQLHDDLYRELNLIMYDNLVKGKLIDIFV